MSADFTWVLWKESNELFGHVSTTRYVSREYYESVHRTSEAFLRFKQATADVRFISKEGMSYIEAQLGHMD